jgi:5-methylcytosine-specific restriction endonuclease McrA
MATVRCIVCNKECNIRTARVPTFKFCSFACRSKWRSEFWTGPNNPAYLDEPRVKTCGHCGKEFPQRDNESIAFFRVRKFCSRACSRLGQKYRSGEEHWLYKPDSRRKNRRGKHGAWARAIISRDKATCQRCGAQNIQLHAHHIESFADHPEKRWDLSNGETLCYRCHLDEHTTASNANGVNSGNIRPGNAEDNPEPSFGRKFIEGVTTRGRAYRRWSGTCDWCGTFISKPWSDTVGKAHLFCSRSCAAKHLRESESVAKLQRQ